MAIESDVLVIGGGLAGLTAGISAARSGATVHLVSGTESTLRQASGLVDVLGYPDGETGPVVDPFAAIDALPAAHPYHLVGESGVRAGLALFDEAVGDAYRGAHTDRNALIPTHGGTVKPTARYPATVAPGLASDDRDVLLVSFEAIPDFDAPLAAARLRAAGVPSGVRGVTLSFPGDFRPDAKLTRYARALEADESVAVDGETHSVREALVERIRAHLDGEGRVGLPAILGVDGPLAVREALGRALDVAIFEVPMGPPSLPGMRLGTMLERAFREAGGHIHTGAPVVDHAVAGDGIDHVLVDRQGSRIPYEAAAYVLATGGLVGKGITASRERVTEPLFGCHVPHPDDRYAWFEDEAFGEHSFPRFGIRADPELRPLDADGGAEFDNLHAAGAVLGGYDFAAEKSGAGVSLATGTRAGQLAAGVTPS